MTRLTRLAFALPFGFIACVGDSGNTPQKDAGPDSSPPADASPGNDVAPTPDAGPWTPAALDADGSLVLWLEASASNVTTSNNLVEKWSDLSKHHNDALNPSGGPGVHAVAINGHDALTFSSDVDLTITDNASLQFGTDQFFIIAVGTDTMNGPLGFFSKVQTKVNISGTNFYQGVELIATSATWDGGTGMIPVARFAQDWTDAGTSTIQSIEYDAPVFNDGKFHIVAARRFDPSTLAVYADGQSATNSGTTSYDVSTVGQNVTIGSLHYGKTVLAVGGDIAEIIVVRSSIVSDATVVNLQTYLKTKYAL